MIATRMKERERKKQIEGEREDLKMFIGTKGLELMIALNMISSLR